MKLSQLILIFAITGYCFAEDPDICATEFEEKLKTECSAIDTTCSLTSFTKKCISNKNNDCSKGDGDQDTCQRTFPSQFPLKKCVYDTVNKKCNIEDTICTDFDNGVYGVFFNENKNYCSQLKANNDRSSCRFSDDGKCESHYNYCADLSSSSTDCNKNILSNITRCYYDTGDSTCKEGPRKCNTVIDYITEDQCHSLKATDDEKQKCVFIDGKCKEEYIKCQDIPSPSSINCRGKYPLIQEGTFYKYDYTYYCSYLSVSAKCTDFFSYCADYPGDDAYVCEMKMHALENKTCHFDPNRSQKCYSLYKTCQLYNDNVSSKTRDECENIILNYTNKKCIYIRESDKCIEIDNYTTCEEYNGTDRYVCESIKSPTTHSNCVLDADLKCKERTFPCTEAYNKEDCLFYAKPVDSTKRCVYYNDACHEIYQRCEDYTGNNADECEDLELYNGKKCVFESDRCRSKDKICEEALNSDECKLISKTGVSDPNKKVCDYITFSITLEDGKSDTEDRCIENFKYCSDYRGRDQTTCENIKPYDESGNYVDETSKCELNDDIDEDGRSTDLCQRISKECSDAQNAVQCAKISLKIKDNHKKYCAYINDNCVQNYKVCEYVPNSSFRGSCTNTIPENYLSYYCEAESLSSGRYKCVSKKTCDHFDEDHYANLCREIHTNCSYSFTDKTCTMKNIYYCSDKKFYTASDENEEVCKSLEVTSPNYVCNLKADKSACEEILKDEYYQTYINQNQQESSSSSEFIGKGIHLIMILLCLLF